MVVVMDKVARILQTRTEPLVIRGHTDRRPYRTTTYDNWRLSAARAHMAYVMLARSGVDEKRFERIEGTPTATCGFSTIPKPRRTGASKSCCGSRRHERC